MYHRVRESKYRIEIVTFVWDFSEHLAPGDTILGTPVIAVIVSSGTDSNPDDMILGSPIVTDGTVVSQKIRRGIPGTIYTITITVNTVQEDTIEDEAYLAILPLVFVKDVILQTALYPIEMVYESLNSNFLITAGQIVPNIMLPEGIQDSISLLSGILFGSPLIYTMSTDSPTNGTEYIQSFFSLLSGVLIVFGGLSYTMSFENIQASFALVTGDIFGSPITYDMPFESIQDSFLLLSGTLV